MKKICTVKHSCSSKRRPKVMTGIGRTHQTSGTRRTTTFSLKKWKKRYGYSVLLFYQHESHLITTSVQQLALLPCFSLLILTQTTRGGRGGDFPMVGLLNCSPTSQSKCYNWRMEHTFCWQGAGVRSQSTRVRVSNRALGAHGVFFYKKCQ